MCIAVKWHAVNIYKKSNNEFSQIAPVFLISNPILASQ